MTTDSSKRPLGRPRVYPGTEKRPTLTFRVRGGLHEQIKASAERNERSLSEEIERRLEDSFRAADTRQIIREEIAILRDQARE